MEKRILILRPDNIGDCILFSGTLKHYRKLFPDARLTLAVQGGIIPIFEKCPYVDEVVDFRALSYQKIRSKKFSKLNFFIKQFLEVTHRIFPLGKKWDIIICSVRSISLPMLWIVKYNDAKRKIGITGCTSFQRNKEYMKKEVFSEYMEITESQVWQHEMKTNLQFMNFLGCDLRDETEISPEYWFNSGALKEINEVPKNLTYTLLIPYGSLPHKELTNERYLEVVARKANTETIIISGTAEDYSRAEELKRLIDRSEKKAINLCGKTSLIQFEQLIRNANSVISVDTGGLHFAIALNKVTHCIVGGGHWGRFFPWGNPQYIHWLNRDMDCFRCDFICKYGDFRCVSNLDFEKEQGNFN